MIIFKSIKWQNILSTGNQFTEIKLNKSKSTIIRGKNGSGKSTLIDALFFVLYNKPFRNINKPQLVNSITNKNLLVEIEFSIGSKEYMVRRGMKPGIFEIYLNGKLFDQNADPREYQELLEKSILKMNSKTFSQVAVLGSANYSPFMQLSPADRRSVVEDVLDIQVFSTMNTLLKERIVENKNALMDVDYKINMTENKIESAKKNLAKLKMNNQDIIDSKQDIISEIAEKINSATTKLQDVEKQKQQLLDSISDKTSVLERKSKILGFESSFEEKIRNLKKDIRFYTDNSQCPTCHQDINENFCSSHVSESQSKIDDYTQKLKMLSEEVLKISARMSEINSVESQISVLQSEINGIMIDIRTWNNSEKILRQEIDQLKNSTYILSDSEEEIEGSKRQLDTYLNTKRTLLEKKELIDVATILLKDGGIKAQVIKKYITDINKSVNAYLNVMNFFVNFELDEKFNETIKSRHRDTFTYSSFSEGEKFRLDIALMMTWREIAKRRNSASTNLLIMDEIFDSSADDEGTEALLNILNSLGKDTNTFVISHKGEELYDKFHSVIQFEKTKNFSNIVKKPV